MWRQPRADERAKPAALTGLRVQIYWDGDRVFYPAVVTGFDPVLRKHTVRYDGDPNPYEEDLVTGVFQVWDAHGGAQKAAPAHPSAQAARSQANPPRAAAQPAPEKPVVRASRATYAEMILDAIQNLKDKNGSSLQAVRKWIAQMYPDTQNKQKASFNQLTLKAITKLVAEGTLEKNKSSFRLSRQYLAAKAREEQREQQQQTATVDLGKAKKKTVFGPGMELVGTSMENNRLLKKELADAREKRDKYLSTRMEYLQPFLPEDNYFSRKERSALVSQMQMKPGREAGQAQAHHTRSTVSVRVTEPGAQQHRFPEELDPSDTSHVNVDGDEILRLLTKLGIVRQDIAMAHSPHQITLGGLFVQELPPLEMSPDLQLMTPDAVEIGDTITEGDFQGYKIVWPGRRLPPNRASLLTSFESYLDWRHVYYLEKQDPITLQVTRQTALRDHTGAFLPHKLTYMRTTMTYARRKNVPISNLITLQYKCPRTGVIQKVVREFCASGHFANVYRRLLHDTLRANPHLMQVFAQHNMETQARKQVQAQQQQQMMAQKPNEVPTTQQQWHAMIANPPLKSAPAVIHGWYQMMLVAGRQLRIDPGHLQQLEFRVRALQHALQATPAAGAMGQPLSQPIPLAQPSPQPVAQPMVAATAPGQLQQPQVSVPPAPAAPSTNGGTAVEPSVKVQPDEASASAMSFSSSSSSSAAAAAPATSSVEATADTTAATAAATSTDSSAAESSSTAAKAQPSGEQDIKSEPSQAKTSETDDSLESLSKQTLAAVPILKPPPSITAKLHQHQLEGFSWMVYMFKNGMPMILGDQMGLGKTIQSITFLAYLRDTLRVRGPYLVVVPLSVMSNWLSEIERFCPSLRAIRFHGPKDERNRIKIEELNDLNEFDLVVTTYEMLTAEANFFRRRYLWRVVIVDEGHRLKNEKSQLSEKIRVVPSVCRVILTGTPMQNNLRELWALLHFLAPDIFTAATSEKFEEGFDLLRNKMDATVLRQARRLLSLFMLRRVKDEIAVTLPERKEITVLVPLTQAQQEWYKQLLTGLDSNTIETVMRESSKVDGEQEEKEVEDGGEKEAEPEMPQEPTSKPRGRPSKGRGGAGSEQATNMNDSDWRRLMNLLLQLRKICNHPYLIPDAAPEFAEPGEQLVEQSGKLALLDRMLPKLREDGHRVLLFSQFTSMLDILEDYCEMRELPYVRLDGDTNRVQRRLDVRRYNAPNSPLFIFLISTRAGGLGLNLATADTVILYDSDWNPQVDLQAMERAHRIGQTKPVRVYRLVCRGSVEERMISRAEKKLFLNAMVAERSEADDANTHEASEDDISQALGVGGATMSKSELAALIRFGANAIVEQDRSDEMDDAAIDRLIGRTVEGGESKTESLFATTGEAALLERQRKLQEVDLRQLGDVKYTKQKVREKDNVGFNPELIVSDGKRQRKERIVMVDGRGSGYGNNVPILAENAVSEEPQVPAASYRSRMRVWSHQDWCVLCGLTSDLETPTRCPHCPHTFHPDCLREAGIPRGAGMFSCPHHRCTMCSRTTAAAGGMLFRCVGCLTSFCEDCLPEDEVESIGRWKPYERFGYFSRQAYYIKCPYCAGYLDERGRSTQKELVAPGMLFAGKPTEAAAKASEEDGTGGDEDEDAAADADADQESDEAAVDADGSNAMPSDDGEDEDHDPAASVSAYPRGPVIVGRIDPEPEPEPEEEEEEEEEEEDEEPEPAEDAASAAAVKPKGGKAASGRKRKRDKKRKQAPKKGARDSTSKRRASSSKQDLSDEEDEDADFDEEGEDEDLDGSATLPAGLIDSDEEYEVEEIVEVETSRRVTKTPKKSPASTSKRKSTKQPSSASSSAKRGRRSLPEPSSAPAPRRASRAAASSADAHDDQTDVSNGGTSQDVVDSLPRRCTIEEAIDFLWSHPSAERFYGDADDGSGNLSVRLRGPLPVSSGTRRLRRIPSLMSIRAKIEGGRYRSTEAFESDLRATLQPFVDQGKRVAELGQDAVDPLDENATEAELATAADLGKRAGELLAFFEQHLAHRLPANRR